MSSRSISIRKLWADPVWRANNVAQQREAANRPERRAQLAAQSARNSADPAVRAKISAARRAAWASPQGTYPWLSAEQKDMIAAAVRAGECRKRVAGSWLISESWVGRIARDAQRGESRENFGKILPAGSSAEH